MSAPTRVRVRRAVDQPAPRRGRPVKSPVTVMLQVFSLAFVGLMFVALLTIVLA